MRAFAVGNSQAVNPATDLNVAGRLGLSALSINPDKFEGFEASIKLRKPARFAKFLRGPGQPRERNGFRGPFHPFPSVTPRARVKSRGFDRGIESRERGLGRLGDDAGTMRIIFHRGLETELRIRRIGS